MAKSIPEIIATLKRGNGSGKVFTPQQVRPFLDKQLKEVADAIKEFMFAELELNSKHKIRRDKSGLWEKTQVTFTSDGGKITIPDYAFQLDQGRRPGVRLVPLEDLIKWLKRYRILGRTRPSGKFKATSQDSINSAAVAIQKAIFRNGIKARPFLEKTLEFQDVLIAGIVDEIMLPQIVSILEFTFQDKK